MGQLSLTPPAVDGDHPRSQIELELDAPETRRGAAVRVTGRVTSAGAPCPHARVDIVLVEQANGAQNEGALIGSVPTDSAGRFDSRVTIPFDIDVGEHTLRASTPGAGSCGASP
jgi:protocatechuate 3,4-dioxygenase beta subunit